MSGLNRIILIDTHLPGVVELKLNGHTNICGTNASGKTTLQRLIPVFYGEYPSRVVPSTRDSFERWYLPRESSYIIYEYKRVNGEMCQAVLSSTGNGVNYRLIAKACDLDDYLDSQLFDGSNCITSAQLGRNMKANGITHTNLLNTTQFRAIVQNDRGVLNGSSNGRELIGYSRLFSLCENEGNLRHIEKLAKAVHSKEGKMETIKAMVAAILEEDGVQPPASTLSRTKVDEWINECQLIQEFDAIRPEFTKLEQCNQELEGNEARLAELKQQFDIDQHKLSQDLVLQQALLDEVILTNRQHESQWMELRDNLNQILSSAKADVSKYEADLDKVETDYQEWQDKDVETHQGNLQKLASWQSELEVAESKYQLLTDKHQDIEASFNRRISELTEKYSLELSLYQEQKAELKDVLSDKKDQDRAQLQAVKQKYQQQINLVQQEHRERLHELEKTHAELASLINHAGFTEQESSELAILDLQIKEAVDSEDMARESLAKANQENQVAQKNRRKVNDDLADKRRHLNQAEKQVAQVEALLYPGQNTLLEFLRKEKPDWQNNLAKIINPDLLQRNDLDPSNVAGNDDSIYGVLLNLAGLEVPEYAQSEQELQEKLETANTVMSDAQQAYEDAEIELEKANELVLQCEARFAQLQTECKAKEATRKRQQQDKDEAQREFKQALSARKAENQKRLDGNKIDQQKLKAQQTEEVTELRDQMREAEMEHQAHWQQVIEDVSQQINQIDLQIQQNKASAKQDKKQCEQWLKDELAERGVDVDEIGTLKKQIKQLNDVIRITEQNRNLVKDYQHWYETIFMGHKVTWQQELSDAKQKSSQTERELNKQTQTYQQTRQDNKFKQAETERVLRASKEQEVELQNIIRQLKKLRLVKVELAADSSSVNQRINEGTELFAKRDELLNQIRSHVDHFDALIAAQSGTGMSDTWEHARQECTSTNAQGIRVVDHRRLVSHLAQLLNVLVPQKLNGLREHGKLFGKDLTSYYHVLSDIDKRIASQSARITKELDEELFLDGVSDSAVRIRSKISELEFWPELKNFERLYYEWQEQGAHELPDQEYADSMRLVLDILGRSALQGGISRLLDIELKLKEGNSELVIRTDRQLNESSSHGMAYLILCKFLLAFTRLLRGRSESVIHWPIDELGTLHQSNVKKIFDACQNNNISVVGAFPNPESEVLTLFNNRYLIDKKTKKLQWVQPRMSPIAERLKKRQQDEVVGEEQGA